MMNSVFLDRNTFAAEVRFAALAMGDLQWHEYASTTPQQLLDHAAQAHVIITNKVAIPGAVLRQLPLVRLIAVAATGVDHIDLDAARERGVAVCSVSGYARHSVAEHVFALLLALRRHLLGYYQAVRAGRWSGAACFTLHDYPINDLHGACLGVIGAGDLGREVARLGEAFGMRVQTAERRGAEQVRSGRVAFEEVLRSSDVISLHVPLTAQTRHLIGRAELARMRPGALLINTARGGVVDELALAEALRAGHLGGAGVDVLSHEPPPTDHPLLAADIPNLLVTPHVAWASLPAQQRLADEVSANIAAYFNGERRNRVT